MQDLIYRSLYTLPVPNSIRDRPMKVLCLGLSRTGTDSLRTALIILGYQGVYHGYEVAMHADHSRMWVPALEAKWKGQAVTSEQFDTVLGHFEALTDNPTNCFAPELLAAYPDAKVIVNRRRDMYSWHASMQKTIFDLFDNRFLRACSWFDARLFWIWQCHDLSLKRRTKGDFDQYGREFATDHYAELEKVLDKTGRPCLDWYVEDGWEPLCRFLGKDVPNVPFPRGNAAGKEFDEKVAGYIGGCIKAATIRMVVAASGLVVLVAVVLRQVLFAAESEQHH